MMLSLAFFLCLSVFVGLSSATPVDSTGLVATATRNPIDDALSPTPTATLNGGGMIIGTTTTIENATAAVNKFLGIPFASPPTGTARFSPPKPTNWNGTRDTKQFGNACIQVFAPQNQSDFIQDVFNVPRPIESEDCLFINVFAPKKAWDASKPPLPILYWFYGGGMKFGNSGQPIYDGSHFAALEDVIVVSVNYRTNVFGFPQTGDITNLTERNLGLLDQRAGLDWIQQNIKNFGGDPSKVTVFGQSAGAYSTDVLLTSYSKDSKPPFRAAILESGTYTYLPLLNCNNSDFTTWNYLGYFLNCTTFDCIKSKPAAAIKDVQEKYSLSFGQACENITYVSDPRLRREAGNFAPVPIIAGSTTQDGSYYAAKFGNDVDSYFKTYFPGLTDLKNEILATYPIGSEGRVDNFTQLTQIHTDWNFHCPTLLTTNLSSKFVPTYRYLFNATFPNTRVTNPNITAVWPVAHQGAYHSSEIPIVFSTYSSTDATPEEKDLSNTMRGAWASFARDPNSAPIQGWPKVGNVEKDVMDFGTDGGETFSSVSDPSGKCDVWKAFFEAIHL